METGWWVIWLGPKMEQKWAMQMGIEKWATWLGPQKGYQCKYIQGSLVRRKELEKWATWWEQKKEYGRGK